MLVNVRPKENLMAIDVGDVPAYVEGSIETLGAFLRVEGVKTRRGLLLLSFLRQLRMKLSRTYQDLKQVTELPPEQAQALSKELIEVREKVQTSVGELRQGLSGRELQDVDAELEGGLDLFDEISEDLALSVGLRQLLSEEVSGKPWREVWADL